MFTKSSRGGNVLVDKMGIHIIKKKENFYVCTEYKKTKSNCPVTAKILEEELIITGGAPQPQLCPNNIYSSNM